MAVQGRKSRLSNIQLHELGLFLRSQVKLGTPLKPCEVQKYIKKRYGVGYTSLVTIYTLMKQLIDGEEPVFSINRKKRAIAKRMAREEMEAIKKQFATPGLVSHVTITHVTKAGEIDKEET